MVLRRHGSRDTRLRFIIALLSQENRIDDLRPKYLISRSTAYSWLKDAQKGVFSRAPRAKSTSLLSPEIQCFIKRKVVEEPMIYLRELYGLLSEHYGISITVPTMSR